MNARVELAAGLLLTDRPRPDRTSVLAQAAEELQRLLSPSTVWQSGYLPPELRGRAAYGEELVWWSPRDDVTPAEAVLLEAAWSAALPPLDRGLRRYLRVRVASPQDVRRLRQIGEVDGLIIVPSLDTPGRLRPLSWRWPLLVGVVAGTRTEAWLATLRDSEHHGSVFDAEPFDPAASYDIAVVAAPELPWLAPHLASRLGETAGVILAGDGPVGQHLLELGELEPAIAVAVSGPPEGWWPTLFHEMCHDVPVDAAVESMVRQTGVDALIAGPRYGMDITAAGHWFAAVAPDEPELEPLLAEFAGWDWRYESGGTRIETAAVRSVRARGGDPMAFVPPPALVGADDGDEATGDDGGGQPIGPPPPSSSPRRLLARVLDGDTTVTTVLPPQRLLDLAVRVAIPERGDVAADQPAPALPGVGPTVNLEVVVRGDVWVQQPAPQTISISRRAESQPSTWAVFGFTSPSAGEVVSIEILLLYQGKPLQAATYVSPVRDRALRGEQATLTTFELSGPDEPADALRPVDVTLDGRGAELLRPGTDAKVLIAGAQQMLDRIEDRVSRVLGVRGAPDSFDDPGGLELLITLAGIGTELGTILGPLDIGDARSINVIVNPDSRVLPLELVYTGPAPEQRARLCDHLTDPPPAGVGCDKASTRRVCPYAFWGLQRSIARTIQWPASQRPEAPWTTTLSTASVLFGATAIADEGAAPPLPTASVFEAAQTMFRAVTRVTNWTAWRKAIKTDKPNVLIVLGHTMVEGGSTNLYIGRKSVLARLRISASVLRGDGGPRPLVLLIACATAALGDPFGSLPGTLTAKGAGAVVGTLAKIVGPHGAAAVTHLLRSLHDLAGQEASVGDAVQAARRSLIAERRPIGLILVSHGEIDTKVGP